MRYQDRVTGRLSRGMVWTMSVASMVRNEEWYTFGSVGFGNGRIVAFVPQWSGKIQEISAFEHSTPEQFNRVMAEDVCGLMPTWLQPVDSMVLLGGGGSYEEDGYVASFRGTQLDWIVGSSGNRVGRVERPSRRFRLMG